MAYLGHEGVIQLRRNSPEPVVVPTSALNIAGNYVVVDYDDWLLGEEVYLIHAAGTVQGYAHRDALDRIYLHTTRAGALSNSSNTLRSFSAVSTSKPVVLAANINSSQLSTLVAFQATLSSLTYERRIRGWPTTAGVLQAQATANPWMLQGSLRSWELSRSAPEIDTGSLGDKFSTVIKSAISGSGSLDFIVQLYSRENYSDVDPLLRFVQLTEQGSTAGVKFYMKQQSAGGSRVDHQGQSVYPSAALYFKADIVITTSSVSVSAEDKVGGSANFVTTGPIRLLSE